MKGIRRPNFLRCAIAAAMCGAATGAPAADETGMWYLNPQYGYTWLDEDRVVDDGDHLGFGIGWHLTDLLSIEVNGIWADFEGPLGRELDQSVYSLDYLLVMGRENRVSPYFTLGGGYIENKFNNDGEYGPLAQAGVGVLMDFGEGNFVFQLRPEVKYRFDWADSPTQDTHGDLLVNLGFAFNFGGGHQAPPPVVQVPPPPPPPPPPLPPKPVDSDGDGVLDPGDRCPGTSPGVAVDSVGCPRGGPVVLRGVEFDNNAASLKPESLSVLDGVADDLRKHPRLRVELQGHTDSRGADAYNLDLSQRRAVSVRDYLVGLGVNPDQLVAKGYGETQPIADNDTPEGRAENRRVVMSVLDNPGNAPVQNQSN